MREQSADGLAVVHTADGLSEDVRDIQNLELGASLSVLVLWNRVGDNDLVNGRCIDTLDGVAAEDTVGKESVDDSSAFVLEQLGRSGDGVRSVSQIVHENAGTIGHVANQHHGGVLTI